jgi:hypothetical protein
VIDVGDILNAALDTARLRELCEERCLAQGYRLTVFRRINRYAMHLIVDANGSNWPVDVAGTSSDDIDRALLTLRVEGK